MTTRTSTQATTNAAIAGRYISTAKGQNYPKEVVDAARMCLVDTIGVAVGAQGEGAGEAVRRVAARWGTAGKAQVILGGRAAPAAAALVNATMAHCLDYDDTHVGATAHLSGPTWNAALAVGLDAGAGEREILAAFIAGFETAARLGGNGFGRQANERGFHSTGVFGCFGAAAAASVLLGLDEAGVVNALGAAATQAAGLVGSFGTMAKPFHSGKAAMNGVLAAELAAEGFVAAQDMVEPEGPLVQAFIQDRSKVIDALDYSGEWELTRNTFKPYSACLLTHPAIDSARKLSNRVNGREIEKVRVEISPFMLQMAGKTDPQTGLEGKFSGAYCVALGLHGYMATAQDYTDARVRQPELRDTLARVEFVPVEGMDVRAARMEVRLADGTELAAETPMALGNPENPMSWDDMRAKFDALVEPVLGREKGAELFQALRHFDTGSLDEYVRLVKA